MAVDKNGKKLPSGIRQRPNGSYEIGRASCRERV